MRIYHTVALIVRVWVEYLEQMPPLGAARLSTWAAVGEPAFGRQPAR
ncbi:MAG: hypothetical protein V3T90_07040 [Anaerolineae bacterium]